MKIFPWKLFLEIRAIDLPKIELAFSMLVLFVFGTNRETIDVISVFNKLKMKIYKTMVYKIKYICNFTNEDA